MTLWIFSAYTSPSAPPKRVKSWANTKILRPSTVPHPVTTPSVSGAVVLDAEPVGAVTGEHVELDERTGVEQQLEPLAGGELAPLVLALDRLRAAGVQRLLAQLVELLEALLDRVRDRRNRRGRAALSVDLRVLDRHAGQRSCVIEAEPRRPAWPARLPLPQRRDATRSPAG